MEAKIGRFTRALIIVYFVEVGAVLIVAPWTMSWDRNYFVEMFPSFETFLTSHVVRGAVTGVGILSLGAAATDVSSAIRRRIAAWLSPALPEDSIVVDTNRRSGLV